MFIKSLQISNTSGIIRFIPFHAGLNLIIDETVITSKETTGNNVGKTTVLMLIDFCLGASGKSIYTDPENRKNEYSLVKEFLISTEVLITLTLTTDLNDPFAERLVIERNFLSRKKMIRRINGTHKTEEEFEATLTNHLFPGHFGKKPTFSQIISHNIRYKDISVSNTLKTLSEFTRDDEYETLYLFLLGCNFDKGDRKQILHANIRMENSFKKRLESKQTRSAYEASLALLEKDIDILNLKKSEVYVNPHFEKDLNDLNAIKYEINVTGSILSKIKLRQELIEEAVRDIESGHTTIDLKQLKFLYGEATERLGAIHRSFEELVVFHNKMIEEKSHYISKELPELKRQRSKNEALLSLLLKDEKELANKLNKSGSLEELEILAIDLNEKYRQKGEFETVRDQIIETEQTIENLHEELSEIDNEIFSLDFENTIQVQINKLNNYFSSISQELYGEQYALKVDKTTNKLGQKIYKFSAFNTNFSSGKKQGEIICFDIAYTLFADNEDIACYHFLLNDKKELMHDNQLKKIADLVGREKNHIQYIASILKDKLPEELNDDSHFILKLSQENKLFKIENSAC